MALENYAKHLTFKYMSAAAIAVINTKPKDVSLEDFVKQLRTSIQNEKLEDECIDLTVCSDDFFLDLDTIDNIEIKDDSKYTEGMQNETNIQNDKFENQCIDLTVCSNEFSLDMDTPKMKDDNKNTNVNNQFIMEYTTTEDKMEKTAKLAETEICKNKYIEVAIDQINKESTRNIEASTKLHETKTLKRNNKYAEVPIDESINERPKIIETSEKVTEAKFSKCNNKCTKIANVQSIKENTKKIVTTKKLTQTKPSKYKNRCAKVDKNHPIKNCAEDKEATENLTETATFRLSEFNTPMKAITQPSCKKQRKSKINNSDKRKYITVTNSETTKSINNIKQLDSQATELYNVPSTQMLNTHISQTQEQDDNRFAILDKYVLGISKKNVPKVIEPIKVVEVKCYENIQSPNIFDSQQERDEDFDVCNEYNIDTAEVIPSINNVEQSKPRLLSNKSSELKDCSQVSDNDIHNKTNYLINNNDKISYDSHNAIEDDLNVKTIIPNTNKKRKWTPATEYLETNSQENEIVQNKCSQIIIDNKKITTSDTMQRKINYSDTQIVKNNESINNLDGTIDTYSDIINNVQNYLNKHDVNNVEEINDNNRNDMNAEMNFNSQNQFTNSQSNFDKNGMTSNSNVLTNNSSYITTDSNLNFDAIILENNHIINEISKQNNIQTSQKPYLDYKGSINNLDNNRFKPIDNIYSQDMELENDIEIGKKISSKNNIQASQKSYFDYKGSINNLDTNKFKPIDNIYSQDMELEDDIEITNTENGIPFKIIMELNEVKSWLSKSNKTCSGGYGTDSGYKSDNQKNGLLSSEKNLNQTAISLLSFVTTQPLSASTFTVLQEISQVLGELVDVLHSEEKYPQFLDKILDNIESLLQDLWNGDSCGDSMISVKNDIIARVILLNQSLHINEYTIEKIVSILEEFQSKVTKTEDLYEISNTTHMENLTNVFHILEIVLKIYLKGKNINISTQRQTQLSNDDTIFKKSSIVDIWKRKWDPSYKKDDVESGTAEKACVTIKCREVLKKIIVDCMQAYSLVSFAALQCFNYLQK